MRILHSIYTLDPSWGGPPRVASRLAAAQAGLGHEVTIIAYGEAAQDEAVRQMTSTIPGFDKVRRVSLPGSGFAERVIAGGAAKRLSELLAAHDVLHIHNVWDAILLRSASAARKRDIPYFVQPNGMLDRWCMEQKSLKKHIALTLGYRKMLNGAATILCGNDDEQAAIRLLGLTAPMINVPLNAVFPDEIAALPPKGSFYKRLPALNGAPFLVFLGRLHFKKGLDFLADAFAIFARTDQRHHLVVVGHDEGAKADFERRIGEAGLADRVHLTGPLHGAAKWEAFADAAAFTLPSRQEGFSIAITEALACGVPVIVSTECHFPEVASAGAGIVAPLEAGAIAKGFRQVLGNEADRRRMSEAARRLVETRFNCRTMAEEVLYAYQSAVQSRAATTNAHRA